MSVGAAPAASSGASAAASSGASAAASSGAVASSGAAASAGAASFSGPGSLPSAVNIDIGGSSNSMSSYSSTGAYGMNKTSLQVQRDALNAQDAMTGKDSLFMMQIAAMQLHKQAFG